MLITNRTTPRPDTRATVILLDGARPDIFDALARAGDLPNISRHVLEPGGRVDATTVFPSTTGVAYLPFLTGRFPGPCGVPGIRWMDPTRYRGRWIRDRRYVRTYAGVQSGLLNTDVDPSVLSIFDVERDSIALCSPFTRGLSDRAQRCRLSRILMGLSAHYTINYGPLDRAVGMGLASSDARFVFAVFPGIDGVSHARSPDHPSVLDLYRAADRDVGRYLTSMGAGPDHLVILVSDHGFSRVAHHLDLARVLERMGLATLRHPKLWRKSPRVAVMVSGNSAAHVYLAPGHPSSSRWPVSAIEAGDVPGIPAFLIDHLTDLHGIDFVAGTDDGDVVVISARGRARISQSGERITYRPETADIFGYGPEARTDDAEGWLRASIDGSHPDGPVQLLQVFSTARSGDLVVSAAPGFDLRDEWEIPELRSGHGSLRADHMLCLSAVSKPVRGPMRSVDVFPMVLDHLGHPMPGPTDGVVRGPPGLCSDRLTVAGVAP